MIEGKFGKFGLMLFPCHRIEVLCKAVREGVQRYPFGTISLADDFLYENTFVALTRLAMENQVTVGTLIAHPFARNILELASAYASLSEICDSPLLVGIASGGALQDRFIHRLNKPEPIVRETATLLRLLFAGQSACLGNFPVLSQLQDLKPVDVRLEFPPQRELPICIGAGGPRMARLAGELGNGVIFSDASPVASVFGMQKGLFANTMKFLDQGRSRSNVPGRFEKIWLTTFSINENEDLAIRQAKRSLSYKLSEYWYDIETFKKSTGFTLADLDLDPKVRAAIQEIKTAFYDKGKRIDEVADLLPDEVVHQGLFTIAGTPDQCRDRYKFALEIASQYGFSHYIATFTEGSDPVTSVSLLAEKVLPHVDSLV